MLYYALILLAVISCGCASTQRELTLAHDVNVPKEYRAGNFSAEHPGYFDSDNCTIARYVDAYERGWICCVERYADNIDLNDPACPGGSGWPEEAYGFSAGYGNARDRIESFINTFGRQKVSAYLQQFRPEFPDTK